MASGWLEPPLRRVTRQVWVGKVPIGGGAPISVQSMTKTDTRDVRATVSQINSMVEAGCEIVRLAVPDREAADSLFEIRRQVAIPLVADIHFDYRLALRALEAGVDKLRINPGNIGTRDRLVAVVKAAKERKVPIRIGVNAGSLEEDLLNRYGWPAPEALVESALRHISILEDLGFQDIVVSLKSSDVLSTIKAYELLAQKVDYPLHLGVTEAGNEWSGVIKTAMAFGALLAKGIGDTVRVSLTADPVAEVRAAYEMLRAFRLRLKGPEVISCPTCGRCEIDLMGIAREVEERISNVKVPIRVAIMGCTVNGPGEARAADVGLAGGKGVGLIFRNGQIVRKVREPEMVDALVQEIEASCAQEQQSLNDV